MANIGYIQVVRHCNHFCGFCSNPTTPYTHTFESMVPLVDDLVRRQYFGVILTGGEPTLHPELPRIAGYAASRGLHVRLITNGHRLADPDFARALGEAGVAMAHVSIYSVEPEVEETIRGVEGTLELAFAALDSAHRAGIEVGVNCVINRLNSDHLDRNVRYLLDHHPQVRHFVWNNLDPSMGRAEVNQELYTPRLADFELSLYRALRLLDRSGRTFRVERVPLCYMTDFAWASTETRKIIKSEGRVVHFLDSKQTVEQTEWGHRYAEVCGVCSLRSICGGLFDHGGAYDPGELHPVFVDRDAVVRRILRDRADPAFVAPSFDEWRTGFTPPEERLAGEREAWCRADPELPVGELTPKGLALFESRRQSDARKAAQAGVAREPVRDPVGGAGEEAAGPEGGGGTGTNSSQP